MLPIRQTASIFKQPVTVVGNRTVTERQTKTDLKHGVQEQPKQVFWEKRLQGLQAFDSSEEAIPSMELPRQLLHVGPELSTENMLQSISAALHVNNGPVLGQSASKQTIMKNPGINMDTHQPHIQQMVVSPEDIHRQEQKVQHARQQLKELIESLD
ncbi:methyl-CpG-binding domain protein 2/3 [Elysia marginata]|uniref:Methyl-CpG-binding domain protein 2/3 n=1 Tax=Elysia marginata TaxID=1093978 RepID=A0AAV4FPT2_9GAST|nr:methyl-CpG-binding domain protein 2/3 [Elysia marginata]